MHPDNAAGIACTRSKTRLLKVPCLLAAQKRSILLVILVGVALLAGCSKTVHWEEEVPLNTGETLVVQRSGTYEFVPWDASTGHIFFYSPSSTANIEFTYRAKSYRHTGQLLLLALVISPGGVPSLIGNPTANDWDWRNKYTCTEPSYIQLNPDITGRSWAWPSKIEPWTFGLKTNLVFGVAQLDANGKRLAAADRSQMNASLAAIYRHYQVIDPTFKNPNCFRGK
jgi:hypothetical protein